MSMKKHRARQYPEDKISDDDKGHIQLLIRADQKRQVVVIEVPEPIKWFALGRKKTLELAALLTQNANLLPDVPEVNSPPATDVQ